MVNLHPIIKLSSDEFLTQIKHLVISIFKSLVKQILSGESFVKFFLCFEKLLFSEGYCLNRVKNNFR